MASEERHPDRLWIQSMEQHIGGFTRQVVPGPGEFDWAEREYVRADRLERTEGLLRVAVEHVRDARADIATLAQVADVTASADLEPLDRFLAKNEIRELLENDATEEE